MIDTGIDTAAAITPVDFIRSIIASDVHAGKNGGHVVTRFPPEPNGHLHIGHAKSICLNFGVAEEYASGTCYLRFDDTNPSKESPEFVEAIKEDVRWLGFSWGDKPTHASDYFERLFEWAVALIEREKAYVCSLSADEIREYRGSLTKPGRVSPYRARSVEENLALFAGMRAGEFAEGTHVLRAKIDMASGNMNMRDPVLYRIRNATHQQTGDRWCIYPMYDFTHCLSDSLEGVTHSLCTLEFEDHRPLYDWFLDQLAVDCHPQQIEFSRLNLEYTVMSKRMLTTLVEGGHVSGWDDPRMPSIRGMRRRGYGAEAIREFCSRIGITKKENMVEMSALESCVREELDGIAPRMMCIQRPLKVVIENFPNDHVESMEAVNHPNDPSMGTRSILFTKEIYVERDDFMVDPPKKFFRWAPEREVRLRYAYVVRCIGYETDPAGEVTLVRCTYDPETKGGNTPDGRKVKGTIHWVSAREGVRAEVRLYDRLFREPNPAGRGGEGFLHALNPNSLTTLDGCIIEPGLAQVAPGTRLQFERLGYYCADAVEHRPERPVFNRTVTLRDTWAKLEKQARTDSAAMPGKR